MYRAQTDDSRPSRLLGRGRGLELAERAVTPRELGQPARDAGPGVIALLRGGRVLSLDDPGASAMQDGDRLVLVASTAVAARRA